MIKLAFELHADIDVRGCRVLISTEDDVRIATTTDGRRFRFGNSSDAAVSCEEADGVGDGWIMAVSADGRHARAVYRPESPNNAFFVTARCSSNCLMCSQPPRDVDDLDEGIATIRDVLDFVPTGPSYIGFTGGEPTLGGERMRAILRRLAKQWPATRAHMLTNGRAFGWREQARAWAEIGHPDFTYAIPLYSDVPEIHDHVVQAKHAFVQTVLGIERLGAWNQRVEIRVVLHQGTIGRLPRLARFVARNFPFVTQVSLMGLEVTGFARKNFRDLWVDPAEPTYQSALAEACAELESSGLTPIILNHQLCVLRPELWRLAATSISDWKRDYVADCDACSARAACGGVFATSGGRISTGIRAMSQAEFDERQSAGQGCER
jgi:His-Xaa-Ser system radical SAM maturase HxsC